MLAAVGGGVWYFFQRQLPQKTVEDFLSSMQKTDFQSMEKLLQSGDMSALNDADIRDESYRNFFEDINKKMSWKIADSRYDSQNGTAQITAHITYIDGSDIYRETISEFFRQVVTEALAGSTLTEAQIQEKLASILTEKAAVTEDRFTETDITYPLIKTDSGWKIVSLDEETVKIMSANFKSVENEIHQTLRSEEEQEDTGDAPEAGSEPEAAYKQESDEKEDAENDEKESPASDEEVPELVTDKFTVRYNKHKIVNDFSKKPCLLVYYDYTNNSDSPSSAMVDVNLQAYQDGEARSAAIPEKNNKALDCFMDEVLPGETVTVCQAFTLNGKGDVTIQISESFRISGDMKSMTLKIK